MRLLCRRVGSDHALILPLSVSASDATRIVSGHARTLRLNPRRDLIRNHPRFKALLEKFGS